MRHCALCFSLRKPSANCSAISSASSPKIGMPPVLAPLRDRINATSREPAAGKRLLAGLGECHFGEGAQTHLTGITLPEEAENPFLGAGRRNGQLQPAAISVLARLR